MIEQSMASLRGDLICSLEFGAARRAARYGYSSVAMRRQLAMKLDGREL
jgi:hypothetical protein